MRVHVPPYAEFVAWLWALPDHHIFTPKDGHWTCGCPVASFLAERNDNKCVTVGVNLCGFVSSENEPVALDYEYEAAIAIADCYKNDLAHITAAAMKAHLRR